MWKFMWKDVKVCESKKIMWKDVKRCEKMWNDVKRCEKMWNRSLIMWKMWKDVKVLTCEFELSHYLLLYNYNIKIVKIILN